MILMPNRIIKESLCVSDNISELSDFEFRLWIGLIVIADDFGRGDARPAIIKGRCFPLRERVTIKDIECALHGLAAHSCVSLYKVGGKPYYSFPTWAAHQRVDRAKPKYPAPEEADLEDSATDCRKSPQIAASRRKSRSESNPIQIQSESEYNPEAEPREAAAAFDTLEAYASGNLTVLSPRNMEELVSFKADMSEELIRHAIDEACANGKRTWAYVRSILSRYLQKGFKSVGDAIADKESFQQQRQQKTPASNPALNYTQRTETNYSSTFINLLDEYGGESK